MRVRSTTVGSLQRLLAVVRVPTLRVSRTRRVAPGPTLSQIMSRTSTDPANPSLGGGEVAAAAEATPTPNANTSVKKSVRICFHLFTYRRNGHPGGGLSHASSRKEAVKRSGRN